MRRATITAAALLALSAPAGADWCLALTGQEIRSPAAWGAPDGRQWACPLFGLMPESRILIGCQTRESPSRPFYADCGESQSRESNPAPAAPEPAPAPEPEPVETESQGEKDCDC